MSTPTRAGSPRLLSFFGLLLLGAGIGVGGLYALGLIHPAVKGATGEAPPEEDKNPDLISFAESKWPAANLKLEEVQVRPFQERLRRGGRVALDEERVAHLSSPLEGVIQEVRVRLGQEVRAGEVLAVLDVRELAQIKLDLVKARTAHEHARDHARWAETTRENTEELLALLEKNAPVAEIETKMKARPIGESRQTLISAYVRRSQLKAQYESVRTVAREAMAESNFQKLKAEVEAAEAAYHAAFEESRHRARREANLGEQKLHEARSAEAIARTQLQLLGFTRDEIDRLDPVAEGGKASLFALKSPLAGTVIDRHAVRSERVGPQHRLFEVADLSSVWIRADVFEADLPLVRGLKGRPVRCRSSAVSESPFAAEVFHPGDLLDPHTRAVTLTAVAPNPGRLLKPGMFVEVEFDRPAEMCLQVPPSAVFRLGNQPLVFVHEGGDRFRKVEVTLGREHEESVEILAGLQPGQVIAATGGFLLKTELLRDQLAGE